jgi:photosystem II stability/assembly factor-like uncharacterized protein
VGGADLDEQWGARHVRRCAVVYLTLIVLAGACGQPLAGPVPTAGATPVVAPGSPPSMVSPIMIGGSQFVSQKTGWVAEYRPAMFGPGAIFKTTDGGQHWQKQLRWDGPNGAQQMLFQGNDGLVVAPNGSAPTSGCGGPASLQIFRTEDGGSHWQTVSLPLGQALCGEPPPLIYFKDPYEGWAISSLPEPQPAAPPTCAPCTTGNPAGVFHTTDSGRHWVQTAQFQANVGTIGCSGKCVYSGLDLQGRVEFRDPLNGFIESSCSGDPLCLWITRDGGNTWTHVTLTPPVIQANDFVGPHESPHFFNETDGVLVVYVTSEMTAPARPSPPAVYIYTTADGGVHWSGPRQLPVIGTADPAFFFLDADHMWMVSDQNVAMSADQGQHWTLHPGVVPPQVFQVTNVPGLPQFLTPSQGWTAGVIQPAGQDWSVQSLYTTADGGLHWAAIPMPAPDLVK